MAGDLHFIAALLALAAGLAVFAGRKGTPRHRRLGRTCLALMIVVNVSALASYEATGRPGPFHVLSGASLLTVLATTLLICSVAAWTIHRRIPRMFSARPWDVDPGVPFNPPPLQE